MSHGKRITHRRRVSKEDLKEQIIYTEENLQPEIISTNPKKEEIIEVRTVEPVPNVTVSAPKRKEGLRRFFK